MVSPNPPQLCPTDIPHIFSLTPLGQSKQTCCVSTKDYDFILKKTLAERLKNYERDSKKDFLKFLLLSASLQQKLNDCTLQEVALLLLYYFNTRYRT